MNQRVLTQATVAGTVLQLAMVLAGHWSPPVAKLFGILGVLISLVAGVMYARLARPAPGAGAVGGAIAGGVCALIGIAVSCALGDVPALILVVGTLSSAVAGAIGGAAAAALTRRPAANS